MVLGGPAVAIIPTSQQVQQSGQVLMAPVDHPLWMYLVQARL